MATAKDKRAAARAALGSFDASSAAPREAAPRTGPGMLLHTVGKIDDLEMQVAVLNLQLKEWEGDSHARLIDPALIDDSAWANRHEASFATPEFAALKNEIASSGGNVQPIKVRAKAEERFEVIFGHRRARACRELGLPVLAVIADQMSDIDLFVEMDRENRQRADLSPWEQGVMYERALSKGLFPSQRKLAEALGIDLSNAGKCLALARLPDPVISAFSSPLDIQLRWGGKLAKVCESDPDRVLARAKKLSKLSPKLKAAEVFTQLVAPEGQGGGSEPPPSSKAKVAVKPDGSAVVKFPAGSLGEGDKDRLERLIAEFFSAR